MRFLQKVLDRLIPRSRTERSYDPYIPANKYEEAIAAYYKYNTNYNNNNTQENSSE